jgi:uncharacterized protein (TIGR03435 family)
VTDRGWARLRGKLFFLFRSGGTMLLRWVRVAGFFAAMGVGVVSGMCAQMADGKPTIAFEAATIKPPDPNVSQPVGFYSYPGGRVHLGAADLKMLVSYAFHVEMYQVSGLPAWADAARYNIDAVPPDSSASRTAKVPAMMLDPTEEQRQMLQNLLVNRFGLKFHRSTQEGNVYFLVRGKGELKMTDAQNKDMSPRGTVMIKGDDAKDGETRGMNVTMEFWSAAMSRALRQPVIDQTGLTGAYDFHVEPYAPGNDDYKYTVLESNKRLGLELKQGKGPVETIVVDSVSKPTEN